MARKRVIVSTPNWPYYRGGIETPQGFSEHEAHHSYVSRQFLRGRGYDVTGVGLRLNPRSVLGRGARRLGLTSTFEGLSRVAVSQADLIVAHRDSVVH